jgi:hypothetical protein
MPGKGDLRYHWVECRLAALDETEMRELVLDAWRMCVPKKVARQRALLRPGSADPSRMAVPRRAL